MAASLRIVTKGKAVSTNRIPVLVKTGLVSLACIVVAMASGCGLMGNLMYIVKGIDLPAEFDELKEKRVAVVVSTSAGYNSDASGILMSRHISELFARNIKKVDVVNPEEVDRIVNDLSISGRTIPAIGERLKAEYVVLVEIANLKLRDGQTLFKGRCNATVSTYKVSQGDQTVFKKSFPEFVFPQHGAPSTDFDEASFQRVYLSELSLRIARTFYPYDPTIDVAKDAAVSSLGVGQ